MTWAMLVWGSSLLMVTAPAHCLGRFVGAHAFGAERRARYGIEPRYVQSNNQRKRNPSPARMAHLMPLYLCTFYAVYFQSVKRMSRAYRDMLNLTDEIQALRIETG